MKNSHLLISVIFFYLVTGLFGKKPNIVIVITDDQGYGDLGCTGNPVIKTPHTDKLANESVWLDRLSCGSHLFTYAGCSDVRTLDKQDWCMAHDYGTFHVT
jgi:hypothetical protein